MLSHLMRRTASSERFHCRYRHFGGRARETSSRQTESVRTSLSLSPYSLQRLMKIYAYSTITQRFKMPCIDGKEEPCEVDIDADCRSVSLVPFPSPFITRTYNTLSLMTTQTLLLPREELSRRMENSFLQR